MPTPVPSGLAPGGPAGFFFLCIVALCGISPDAYPKDLLGPDILSRTPVALSAASVLPSGQH